MDHWYFAYGSNMLSAQMIARTGPLRTGVEGPRIARLPKYRLAFNMLGEDGQIYANIVPGGDGVTGVVYRCNAAALEKLDQYENGYERVRVIVLDNDGYELGAVVFVALPDRVTAEGQPSAAYLHKIVTGAQEHGLPAECVQALKDWAK